MIMETKTRNWTPKFIALAVICLFIAIGILIFVIASIVKVDLLNAITIAVDPAIVLSSFIGALIGAGVVYYLVNKYKK